MDVSIFAVMNEENSVALMKEYNVLKKQLFKVGFDIKQYAMVKDLLGVDYKSFSNGLTLYIEDDNKIASSLLVPLNHMEDLGNQTFISAQNNIIVINYKMLNSLDVFKDLLKEHLKLSYETHCVKCFGIKEENLANYLKEFKNSNNIFDCFYEVEYGEGTIIFRFLNSIAKNIQENIISTFVKDLKSTFFASKDINLITSAYELLTLRNISISIAETFTSGYVTNQLNKFFHKHNNLVKKSLTLVNEQSFEFQTNVDKECLSVYGVNSPETAYELVTNLLNSVNCDIAISIVGDIEESDNQFTCNYFTAIGDVDAVNVYKHKISGSKDFIIHYATNTLIFELIKKLRQNALNISNFVV